MASLPSLKKPQRNDANAYPLARPQLAQRGNFGVDTCPVGRLAEHRSSALYQGGMGAAVGAPSGDAAGGSEVHG